MTTSLLLGQLSCLLAALLWATAVVVFRRAIVSHGAPTVNLLKGALATALLLATSLATGAWGTVAAAPAADVALLAASGIVGITVGDTALFAAVVRIGVHNTMLLQTLAPVFAALLATLTGERLSPGQLAGSTVILAGIVLVVGPGGQRGSSVSALAATGAAGLALGVLAAFGQGAGVVVAKAGMDSLSPLPATLVRLAAATAGLLLVAGARRDLGRTVTALRDRPAMARIVPATLFGTYLAMLLMMAGIALAPASVAAVLLATTPVFSLLLEAWIQRRPPATMAILGTLLAIAGVAMLTLAA